MGINLEHPNHIEFRNRISENPKDFVAFVGTNIDIGYDLVKCRTKIKVKQMTLSPKTVTH